jgi:hypothetical protein
LQVSVWPNAARSGPAASFRAANLSQLAFPGMTNASVFSVDILGSIQPPYQLEGESWELHCAATAGLSVFVHVDDHLVCQSGHDPLTWVDFKVQNQIPFPGAVFAANSNASYTLRVALLHHTQTAAAVPSFTLAYRQVKTSNLPPLLTPALIGCFASSKAHLLLNGTAADGRAAGPAQCSRICAAYRYFGLAQRTECWCGDTYTTVPANRSHSCNVTCSGDASATCGDSTGDNRTVYQQRSADELLPLRPVPSSAFEDAVTPAQEQWLNMSRRLTDGRWGAFSRNSLTTQRRPVRREHRKRTRRVCVAIM